LQVGTLWAAAEPVITVHRDPNCEMKGDGHRKTGGTAALTRPGDGGELEVRAAPSSTSLRRV
jgi:hypothetical protein